MCYEFEYEYLRQRAEEARRQAKKADERKDKPEPAVPDPGVKEGEPVPA